MEEKSGNVLNFFLFNTQLYIYMYVFVCEKETGI